MIVVATEDFAVYHDVVEVLRDRQVAFTTVEPGSSLPADASAVIVGPEEGESLGAVGFDEDDLDTTSVPVVTAEPGEARKAVEAAIGNRRRTGEQVVVGIDPGTKPGIAVLVDDTVVAAYQVPLEEAHSVVEREIGDASDPVVRIGDGARLRGSRVVDELEDVRIELVDETGTTPYLGTGARGMGDVLAAANIARTSGEPIEGRSIEPTAGELREIKEQSRRESDSNRTIPTPLARSVATGELTMKEALAVHRDGEATENGEENETGAGPEEGTTKTGEPDRDPADRSGR